MVFDPELVSLEEAGACLPKRKSKSTLWRWCRQGYRGVRLKYVMYGRGIYTKLAWLHDFAERCAALGVDEKGSPAPRVPVGDIGQRDAESRLQAAQTFLEQVGLRERQHAAA